MAVTSEAKPDGVIHWHMSDRKLRGCVAASQAKRPQFGQVKGHLSPPLLKLAVAAKLSSTTVAAGREASARSGPNRNYVWETP